LTEVSALSAHAGITTSFSGASRASSPRPTQRPGDPPDRADPRAEDLACEKRRPARRRGSRGRPGGPRRSSGEQEVFERHEGGDRQERLDRGARGQSRRPGDDLSVEEVELVPRQQEESDVRPLTTAAAWEGLVRVAPSGVVIASNSSPGPWMPEPFYLPTGPCVRSLTFLKPRTYTGAAVGGGAVR